MSSESKILGEQPSPIEEATTTTTTTTTTDKLENLYPYTNSTSGFKTEVTFSPTILNVKRGIWHALVRTAAQLDLTNLLAHKNDETNNNRWNIGWVDKASMIFYRSLSRYQKINHLLGVEQLCRKRNLARVAKHIHNVTDAQGTNEYSFIPRSWVLPRELDILRAHMTTKINNAKENKEEPPAYIIKPGSSCQGRGIYLAQTLEDIEIQQGYVVQEYIHNPLCILGRKFDLRIYVLQTSSQPLRLYVYEDGLARFCTKQYEKPNAENIKGLFSHLTNFSLNKLNKEEFVDSGNNDDDVDEFNPRNNKWSLLQFNDYIYRTFGLERFTTMWQNINDIIIKTIMGGLPIMNEAYSTLLSEMNSENNVNFENRTAGFQLYGFDIMFDENWKPWLIEVNRNPSLRCEASVDEYIKTQLLGQLAMILDPVTSLSPQEDTIKHIGGKIYNELIKHPQYDAIFTQMAPKFKDIYMKLIQTADNDTLLAHTPTSLTPFFSTRVSDDQFWHNLVQNDKIYNNTARQATVILFLQSIFDIERVVAKKLYTGSLLSFWLRHKDLYELHCRLSHEDRAVDSLHETTLFWHDTTPPTLDQVKAQHDIDVAELNKIKIENPDQDNDSLTTIHDFTNKPQHVLVQNSIPTCVGSSNIGGFVPLLSQSPSYRKNGFSRFVTKQHLPGQPTPSIHISRDPRTNIPIYASNFRTIYPIEPYSDYPYPYSKDQLPKQPVDKQLQDEQNDENGGKVDGNNGNNVNTEENAAPKRIIPRYIRPRERLAAMEMYRNVMLLTTKAAQPFISIAVREAVSGTMGLAGYPTIAWSNSAIVDERSVRELQSREANSQKRNPTAAPQRK
jgi:tubulin polyglutamylase TTLL6/13